MIIGIELHDGPEIGPLLLGDEFEKQLLLVLEIDIERALRHPGNPGDVVHAGGIETILMKDLAGAIEDLAALAGVLPRARFHPLLDQGHIRLHQHKIILYQVITEAC